MRYLSTRGGGAALGFDQVVLQGLAPDGGLFVPETIPFLTAADWRSLRGLRFPQLGAVLMQPFVAGSRVESRLEALLEAAYAGWPAAVTPLVQLDHRTFLLDLTGGPTLAFKDVALGFVGQLFRALIETAPAGQPLTVLGATSGDTGAAAIHACRGVPGLASVILMPEGGPSDDQRRLMTTTGDPNVHVLALQGSFDEAQAIVKALFQEQAQAGAGRLLAINSINWARVLAQTVYYAYAALSLGAPDRPVVFAVPSGNMGNALAGHIARLMGLPVPRIVLGTNANDALARLVIDGTIPRRPIVPTLAPAMDIQVPSNVERLLFELAGRDPRRLTQLMGGEGEAVVTLGAAERTALGAGFLAARADDAAIARTMREVWQQSRGTRLVDPHTACGLHALETLEAPLMAALTDQLSAPEAARGVPRIALACAHPAKFPETVTAAIEGLPRPSAPAIEAARLAEERLTVLPPTALAVRAYMQQHGLI